jgi:hypothetical protein
MDSKMVLTKQNLHLAAAYYRMSSEGRNTLDQLMKQLAGVHDTVCRSLPVKKYAGERPVLGE